MGRVWWRRLDSTGLRLPCSAASTCPTLPTLSQQPANLQGHAEVPDGQHPAHCLQVQSAALVACGLKAPCIILANPPSPRT